MKLLKESADCVPVLPGLAGPVPDDLGVNRARHAVVELGVELREDVGAVHGGIGDVSDGGSLDDVPDDKLPDGLVLGAGLAAVGATDVLHVSTAMLIAAVVPPLLGHLET